MTKSCWERISLCSRKKRLYILKHRPRHWFVEWILRRTGGSPAKCWVINFQYNSLISDTVIKRVAMFSHWFHTLPAIKHLPWQSLRTSGVCNNVLVLYGHYVITDLCWRSVGFAATLKKIQYLLLHNTPVSGAALPFPCIHLNYSDLKLT